MESNKKMTKSKIVKNLFYFRTINIYNIILIYLFVIFNLPKIFLVLPTIGLLYGLFLTSGFKFMLEDGDYDSEK